MKNWWKVLGVILMFYVLIAGFLIPLKPGILDFSPSSLTVGTPTTVSIETYNTKLQEAGDTRVWLKLPNDKLLKASNLTINSDTEVDATFNVAALPDFDYDNNELTLVIDNSLDGYALYPGAIDMKPAGEARGGQNTYHELSVIKDVDDFKFPYRHILYETIRNTFFHVAIWFAMFLLCIYSCFHSVKYLIYKDLDSDFVSMAFTSTAIVFGIAGILTGSVWAKYTWGTFWTTDIKLNMSASALLVYAAYWVLRSSINDIDTRARLSAVYNIFAFVCLMILVMVIPRFTDSLHPGNGGNPALGGEDMDNTLRSVFYPAIIGYTLIGCWIAQLYYRYLRVEDAINFED